MTTLAPSSASNMASPPLLFLLLLPTLLPTLFLLPPSAESSPSPRTRPVFGTERYARSAPAPHRRLVLRTAPAPFLLRQPLPAPRLAYPMSPTGLEPYRAFVEQEEFPEGIDEEGEEEGEVEGSPYVSSEAAYRHAMRGGSPLPAAYSLADPPQYRFSPPYSAYYEGPPEISTAYGRPAAPASIPRRLAADPVEDLEEEMREEEAGGWSSPWWNGGDVEDEAAEEEEEAEREAEEEEAAERAATDGAFLRNLILAQRYRDDSLRPEAAEEAPEGKRRRINGRRTDSGDRAVRELESLAGKRPGPKRAAASTPENPPVTASPVQTSTTSTPLRPSERGQKEVAVPRPASPPRRPLDAGLLVGRRWPEVDERGGSSSGSGRSVYAALERLLEAEAKDSPSASLQRHRTSSQRSLQKRFVSGEDVMMRQLNELKRA